MKSMFNHTSIAGAVLALTALAGCNAVEDVREEPTIEEPPPTVVLQGVVTGLGSRRGLLLTNNGQDADAVTVIASVPTQVSTAAEPVSFSFGSRAVTNASGNPVPYSIQIKQVPYGKRCAFRAGSQFSGTLSAGTPPPILIDCTPDPAVALYDIRVYLDPGFSSASGAKVQLRTEEAIYEKSPTPADITAGFLTFDDLLFNSSSNILNGPLASPAAPAGSPVFEYNVTATTSVGGTVNRCPVVNPSNAIAVTGTAPNQVSSLQNPSANITASTGPAGTNVSPRVGACSFTISGAVHYSRPAGVASDAPLASGLVLELRDLNGVKKGTATVAGGSFPANPAAGQTSGIGFTFNNTDTPATTAFTSNPNADFQVVVATQPAGQTCILQDGGYVSLKSLINLNPVSVTATGTMSNGVAAPTNVTPVAGNPTVTPPGNVPIAGTRLVVFCRNSPALADRLHGVYRLTRTVASFVTSTGATTAACTPSTASTCTVTTSTLTSRWAPFDLTVQNTASSNLLTFFEDGTFLYGTHMQSAQVEHGFYDYSATLRADDGTPAAGAPAAAPGRLRFTVHTDTFPNTVFPTPPTFNVNPVTTTGTQTTTPGISALPGPLFYGTVPAIAATAPGTAPLPLASRHANLGNVVKTNASGSAPARITGTAGPFGGSAATISTPGFTFRGVIPAPSPTGTATTASVARQVDWELTEVPQATGEMTGGWVSQDYRRFWVWDKATDYGFAVGVNGLTNLQSSCFVTENAVAPTGSYQRRSGQTLCYPINRPMENQTPPFGGILDTLLARDNAWVGVTHLFATTGTAPAAPAGLLPIASNGNVVNGQYSTGELTNRFPNFESRIPGGFSVLDGRSPSPIVYHVGPAASFFTAAPAQYFPQPAAAFTTWCNSDILGIRSTLNGLPFREPVYMCRTPAR